MPTRTDAGALGAGATSSSLPNRPGGDASRSRACLPRSMRGLGGAADRGRL